MGDKNEIGDRSRRVNNCLRPILAAGAVWLLTAPPAVAQVLRGTVMDNTSGQPVAGARVQVFDTASTRMAEAFTSSGGRFTFRLLPPGRYWLLANRLGYSTATTAPIALSPGAEISVPLRMARNPVSLDTLTVVGDTGASKTLIPYLAEAGFYRRQRTGFGHFLTRVDIDKHSPLVMSDVLRGLAGVRVVCGEWLSCDVEMRAATTTFLGRRCQPSVILDGVVLRVGGKGNPGDLRLDDVLNPFSIEAIEIYPGAAGVPVQYLGYLSPCGAILAWSRH